MDGGGAWQGGPGPGWGDVRQAVMCAADACACAAAAMALRGSSCGPAAALASEAVTVLREAAEALRPLAVDEAAIEAEVARRVQEHIAAAGLVPSPRRHLRAV